jgi:hypothetical protein
MSDPIQDLMRLLEELSPPKLCADCERRLKEAGIESVTYKKIDSTKGELL